MKKIKIPSNMDNLLKENIQKVGKKNEKVIAPKIEDSFDKQQSERFKASAKNFTEWNMEFRKELYGIEPEALEQWKEDYGEKLLEDWKAEITPKDAAMNVAILHRDKSVFKMRKSLRRK